MASDITKRYGSDGEFPESNGTEMDQKLARAEVNVGRRLRKDSAEQKNFHKRMRDAAQRDKRGVSRLKELKRLKVGEQQTIKKPHKLKIRLYHEAEDINKEAVITRSYEGEMDDSLDGILFIYAPPCLNIDTQDLKSTHNVTRLSYHPHFYMWVDSPTGTKLELLDPWTPLKDLTGTLYLVHNRQRQPFILLSLLERSVYHPQPQLLSVTQHGLDEELQVWLPKSGDVAINFVYDHAGSTRKVDRNFNPKWGEITRSEFREWRIVHVRQLSKTRGPVPAQRHPYIGLPEKVIIIEPPEPINPMKLEPLPQPQEEEEKRKWWIGRHEQRQKREQWEKRAREMQEEEEEEERSFWSAIFAREPPAPIAQDDDLARSTDAHGQTSWLSESSASRKGSSQPFSKKGTLKTMTGKLVSDASLEQSVEPHVSNQSGPSRGGLNKTPDLLRSWTDEQEKQAKREKRAKEGQEREKWEKPMLQGFGSTVFVRESPAPTVQDENLAKLMDVHGPTSELSETAGSLDISSELFSMKGTLKKMTGKLLSDGSLEQIVGPHVSNQSVPSRGGLNKTPDLLVSSTNISTADSLMSKIKAPDLTGLWEKLSNMPISGGGNSDVYKARLTPGSHPYTEQIVAVKMLRSVRVRPNIPLEDLLKRVRYLVYYRMAGYLKAFVNSAWSGK
ncbi:hypothetical protein FRC02_012307 [Tulasnella sp. 418]|nr:hypothetical protein FRC02_012307 [Tulasnella sp. 418]